MPISRTSRSAPKTPSATPTVTSATRRSRWPYDVPSETTAATGAKNGAGGPRTSLREPPGDARRDRALGDRPALGAPPIEPCVDRGATPVRRRSSNGLATMTPILPRRTDGGLALVPYRTSGQDRPMVHPLDPTAAGFLMAENRRMPMHVGGLQLFTKPEGAGRNYVRDLYTQLIESEDIAPLLPQAPAPVDQDGRPVGVGRGRRLRHRVPRPPQRPAEAGPRPRAARALLPPALHPAGDRAAPVGVAPDRGSARRAGRDVLQAPPRARRRRLRDAAAAEHPQQRPRPDGHAGPVGAPPLGQGSRRRPRPAWPTCRSRRCSPPSRSAPRRPACRARWSRP